MVNLISQSINQSVTQSRSHINIWHYLHYILYKYDNTYITYDITQNKVHIKHTDWLIGYIQRYKSYR